MPYLPSPRTSSWATRVNQGVICWAKPASFLLLLIGPLIAVLVAVLVVQWIIRLRVLVVAVGIAPIAMALHGTPQTGCRATILGTVGTVVM